MDTNPPSMDQAYRELRPLLFSALGKLAKQGLAVSPADGMDLIHDFFAEAWEGIVSRYDPLRGRFEVYVYGAFVHFARPRIIRLLRWQTSLIDPDELGSISDDHLDVDREFQASHDTNLVAQLLEKLPPYNRDVLSRYIYSSAHSERLLAKEFSISRYRLRETLVDALGRLVVLLDKPGSMPASDWQVAKAIWQEERSVSDAALHLKLTEHQIRTAHSRNLKLLAQALKYYRPVKGIKKRSDVMESEARAIKKVSLQPRELLETALKSPGADHLLVEVRKRAKEIFDALECDTLAGPELGSQPECKFTDLNFEWTARVYEALAQEEVLSEEEFQSLQVLFEANASSETSIGYAYKDVLVPSLPGTLQLERQFEGLPKVSEREAKEWLETPAAQAALPYSKPLAAYAVTPMTVLHVSQAISTLVYRLRRNNVLSENGLIVLWHDEKESCSDRGERLEPQMVIREIKNLAECQEDVAERFLPWMIDVAQLVPYFLVGFHAEQDGTAVCLSDAPTIVDVYERWQSFARRPAVTAGQSILATQG